MHSRTLPIDDPDDASVWAVNCLFVKSGYRGQGMTRRNVVVRRSCEAVDA